MNDAFRHIWTITKRELSGYFASPVAYVFIVIFLLLNGFFTFMLGGFFEIGEASLSYSRLLPCRRRAHQREGRRLGCRDRGEGRGCGSHHRSV